MKVKTESPVEEKESLAYQWDTESRKYFSFFEMHLSGMRKTVATAHDNIFLQFRNPQSLRVHKINELSSRQLLGDISKEEVKEACKVAKGPSLCLEKGVHEPA